MIAALALMIATTTGPTTSSTPSHGSSVVPAAATTSTPAPPAGVEVRVTQDDADCTLTVHITNTSQTVGMLSRTDWAGNQPPWAFRPGGTVPLPVNGMAWSARIDWPNGTSTPLGAHAFAPLCIGAPPATAEIGTAIQVARNTDGTDGTTTTTVPADTPRRGWGWRT